MANTLSKKLKLSRLCSATSTNRPNLFCDERHLQMLLVLQTQVIQMSQEGFQQQGKVHLREEPLRSIATEQASHKAELATSNSKLIQTKQK